LIQSHTESKTNKRKEMSTFTKKIIVDALTKKRTALAKKRDLLNKQIQDIDSEIAEAKEANDE